MRILGLTAWFHDSSACLVEDGRIVAFAEEERFSRVKHSAAYPSSAVDYCLRQAGIDGSGLNVLVFYLNPLRTARANFAYLLKRFPLSLNLLRPGATLVPMSHRYAQMFNLEQTLTPFLPKGAARPTVVALDHFRTHQASAFLCSPFPEAAILTMDMAIDGTTQTIAHGRGSGIRQVLQHRLPHGWAMLYTALTRYLGFQFFDEYKVMGMAAYGQPSSLGFIERELYRLDDETGAFELNLRYFSFQHHALRRLWSHRLVSALGPPRDSARPLEQRDYDLAASVQVATERFGVRMARLARKLTGSDALTLSGGVAQNVLMNQRIAESGIFKEIFVQPLAGDAGCALGGALYHYHVTLGKPRGGSLEHLYLGPSFESQYEAVLSRNHLQFHRDPSAAATIARALADGLIVGFFSGRMEAGPRALGGRSILADPRRADTKDVLNRRVKHREHFRPFAPSVLEEFYDAVFEPLPAAGSLPFMITTANVRADMRDKVPAITHQDGTARPQVVSRRHHPRYWAVIEEFRKLTGIPLVVNTSFNDNEPIVCTPQDAVDCFLRTEIDLLAFDDYLVFRRENRAVLAS